MPGNHIRLVVRFSRVELLVQTGYRVIIDDENGIMRSGVKEGSQ